MNLQKLKLLILDTPEEHWLIVAEYHIHKAFWGCLLLVLGVALIILLSSWLFTVVSIFGVALIISDILGHIHTKHKPYFVLAEKYNKVG